MSKLINSFEAAIKAGDWSSVCDVFFKMTGKKIDPPAIKPIAIQFDPTTATKTQLYKKIKELNPDIGPAKNFSSEDLLVMYKMYYSTDEDEIEVSTTQVITENDWAYVPPNARPLNGDKIKVTPRLTDFDTYDDEGGSKVQRTRKNDLIKAVCRKCKKTVSVSPVLITGTSNDGQKMCICHSCGHG